MKTTMTIGSLRCVSFLALALTIASVWAPHPVTAQPVTWQAVGPFGANIRALDVDVSGALLAKTYYGIYQLEADAERWRLTERSELYVNAIEQSGGVLFARQGTGPAFYYRSDDGGHTWSKIKVPYTDWRTGAMGESSIRALVVGAEEDYLYAAPATGVVRSPDDGDTWVAVGDSLLSREVVFDLLTVPGGDVYAIAAYRLYRSTDHGETWEDVHGEELPEDLSRLYRTPDGALLTSTYDSGLYRRAREDTAWVNVGDLRSRKLISAVGGALYLVGYDSVLYRSLDDGVTWSPVTQEVPYDVQNVAEGPGHGLYVGTSWGVYGSTDRGDTWRRIDDGMLGVGVAGLRRDAEGSVWAETNAGTFRMSPGSASWTRVKTPGRLLLSTEELLYAGNFTSLYRSPDGGQTWEAFAQLDPPYHVAIFNVRSLSLGPNGLMLAVASGKYLHDNFQFVHVSNDGGDTWSAMPFSWARVGHVTSEGVLLVGTSGSIERSSDGGQTWTRTASLGVGLSLRGFAEAANGDLLLAAFNTELEENPASGLYRSSDQGVTWTQVDLGSENSSLIGLASAGNGHVALTHDGRLYRTTGAQGDLVAQVDESIPDVETFSVGPDGTIYVGTESRGVYRSSRPVVTATGQAGADVPSQLSLEGCFPNPFREETTVTFNLSQPAQRASLTVYDLLGREVMTLVDGPQPAGRHEVPFTARGLPSGTYLYRLVVDGTIETETAVLLK